MRLVGGMQADTRSSVAVREQSLHYLIDRIQPRHGLAQARSSGLTEAWAKTLLNELIGSAGKVLEVDVAEAIFDGIGSSEAGWPQG
ncbi:MAG: hypothetical protein ACRC02_14200 [Vogesella sp.]|uniref:hypothetical protein n=1 Tax=Vogesella sp. TaxID=1904252 RepID=UPI003F3004B7